MTTRKGSRAFYARDAETFTEIEHFLASIAPTFSGAEIRALLEREIVPRALSIQDEIVAESVFGIAVSHPHPIVRAALVDVVANWLPHPTACETLSVLLQDPDDVVCMRAIHTAGEERVEHVIPYLIHIVGWPDDTMDTPRKPVGMGAAHVQAALLKILGKHNRDEVRYLRAYYERFGKLPDELAVELTIREDILRAFQEEREPGMILIPGGWFNVGLSEDQVPSRIFKWEDSVPPRRVWLPPFLLDEYPVTNSEYDRFCRAVETEGHIYCHPNEPDGKDHTRNTFWDDRFAPDHPATGIDWFDAYAYARWAGKDLPNEFQWERAARGEDGTVWPWGGNWNPEACNWAGLAFGKKEFSLEGWRRHLVAFDHQHPPQTTTPVTAFKDFASSFGAVDMIGNAWEWTKSDKRTGRAFVPALMKRYPDRVFGVVLKGGSWTSLPGMMFPSYRGQDSPLCRHNEIGFRCVRNVPLQALRGAGLGKIQHTGIY